MISVFTKQYEFLSNFSRSRILYERRIYPTAEHLYQALKTLDKVQQNKILSAGYPAEAKRLGNTVTLRSNWEEIKVNVMLMILLLKFTQNIELAKLLCDTGDEELCEGNYWHDNFWGKCTCTSCLNGTLIVGQNMLGLCLMEVRQLIEAFSDNNYEVGEKEKQTLLNRLEKVLK